MTAANLPDIDRGRLGQLLGMLGSSYDGERANAGRMADRVVKDAGLTWHDVITPKTIVKTIAVKAPPDTPKPSRRWKEPHGLHECLAVIERHVTALSDWEREFVSDMHKQRRCSRKQAVIIERLVDRARGIAHRPHGYEGV